MVAGIPGTSISGLYYILLAFLMPVKEAYLSCNGRSSMKRWMHVALQMINAAGIIGCIFGTGWVLSYLIKKSQLMLHGQIPQQVSSLMSLTSACAALAEKGSAGVCAPRKESAKVTGAAPGCATLGSASSQRRYCSSSSRVGSASSSVMSLPSGQARCAQSWPVQGASHTQPRTLSASQVSALFGSPP